jgi:hypothetical protein
VACLEQLHIFAVDAQDTPDHKMPVLRWIKSLYACVSCLGQRAKALAVGEHITNGKTSLCVA